MTAHDDDNGCELQTEPEPRWHPGFIAGLVLAAVMLAVGAWVGRV